MHTLARILLPLLLALPLAAHAQSTDTTTPGDQFQFQRQGVFDCNKNGAYGASVGATSAIGGAYVPVADAAVELNTGMLVYKECVLREVVDTERQNALTGFLKKAFQADQTGRNGQAQHVVNYQQEKTDVSDQAEVYSFLNDGTLDALNPALQQLKRPLAQAYYTQTRAPESALTCPYQGNLSQWRGSQGAINLSDFWKASAPQCYPLFAFTMAQDIANSRIGAALEQWQTQLDWGRGFYPVTDNAQNPLAAQILTPASVVEQSFEKLLQSPIDQLQSANDVGQMIGALYAGLTTQVISDTNGLAGIGQSNGGQPSYLDRVTAESASAVRNAAANAALNILNPALQIEQAYYSAANSIAAALTQSISQLRTAERQCWDLVIPAVCSSSLSSSNTCTDAAGETLHVATSTAFSQPVIDSQIAPLASSTLQNLQNSQNALALIQNLIDGVTNTTSLDAQRLALQQLDGLVANHKLHTQPDLQSVTTQLSSVQDTMQTLVTDTVNDWADGTPNGSAFSASNHTGWCNTNDQATIDTWTNTWK